MRCGCSAIHRTAVVFFLCVLTGSLARSVHHREGSGVFPAPAWGFHHRRSIFIPAIGLEVLPLITYRTDKAMSRSPDRGSSAREEQEWIAIAARKLQRV